MLHVQEVRGQSPFRGVRVVVALALLFVAAGLGLSAGAGGTSEQTILVQGVGDAAVDDAQVEILGLAT